MPKTFIIAEAGVNHNGSLETALQLVRHARDAGADAVKFQAFRAEAFDAKRREICKPLELSPEKLSIIAGYCRGIDIEFMCTPFQADMVALVQKLGVMRMKVSSSTLPGGGQDWYVLNEIKKTGLPIIASTGRVTMQRLVEFARDIEQFDTAPPARLTYLACISEYPTLDDKPDLAYMDQIKFAVREALSRDINVGWSDHTRTVWACVAAAYAGATVIEKHITLDPGQPGPDHVCSADPSDFATMVREIRRKDLLSAPSRLEKVSL